VQRLADAAQCLLAPVVERDLRRRAPGGARIACGVVP
jgi:hypothetical protein